MRAKELTAEFGIAGTRDLVETGTQAGQGHHFARRYDGGALPQMPNTKCQWRSPELPRSDISAAYKSTARRSCSSIS